MLFWVGKFFQPLLWPFNQALILLAIAVVLLWREKLRPARILVSFAFGYLFVMSLPWLAIGLYLPLETEHLPKRYDAYPQADAIVVLGGTMSALTPPRVEIEEMHGSRVIPAYQLWRRKKAPIIVLSSGSGYVSTAGARRVESEDMRDFLMDLGAPSSALIVEANSRNTYENAFYSAEYLRSKGKKTILLVTSAFHMRRALPLFEAEGLSVTPVATEHHLMDRPFSFWDLVPDLNSLGYMTGAIKERVGLFVYNFVLKSKKREMP